MNSKTTDISNPKKAITFIYPGITTCGFGSFGKGMDSSWVSHGLGYLSAVLKKKGYVVDLIDLRTISGWTEFRKLIKKKRPSVVGIPMMSVDYNPGIKAAKTVKKIDPSIKIIVGGPHPTLAPNELIKHKEIDYIFKGEGEITLPVLLEKIFRKEQEERIIQGAKPDLNKLPFVDREIFSALEKPIVKELPEPFLTTIAGRGCVYNCSFCKPAENTIFGLPVRRRSVQNVIRELNFLRRKYHFQSLMIHDDCLLENSIWAEEFCKEYKKAKFKQPFVCQSRADLICRNEKLVKKMKKTGLFMFLIGFESGSQRVLNFIRKGTTVEQNYRAAEICRKYGIKIWANYMVGLPTETKNEVMETVWMIRKIKPDYYSPAYFTPHPGSDLYEYCQKNKLSLIKNHDQYNRGHLDAKIKGHDYRFLKWAVDRSTGETFLRKVMRKLRYLGLLPQ